MAYKNLLPLSTRDSCGKKYDINDDPSLERKIYLNDNYEIRFNPMNTEFIGNTYTDISMGVTFK